MEFVYQGYAIPPFYDSMIAKLIVCAPTREEAVRKLNSALCEMVVEGVCHNRELLLDLIDSPAFLDGTYHTGTLAQLCEAGGQ